jgi:hypothetical protein
MVRRGMGHLVWEIQLPVIGSVDFSPHAAANEEADPIPYFPCGLKSTLQSKAIFNGIASDSECGL